jgi:hypothetical protein
VLPVSTVPDHFFLLVLHAVAAASAAAVVSRSKTLLT